MKRTKRITADSKQVELFAIIPAPPRRSRSLRVGDVIRYHNRLCRVVRVTDCAAVVIMNQRLRVFTTRFDRAVSFQPSPARFRISRNSETEVLNRKPYERR